MHTHMGLHHLLLSMASSVSEPPSWVLHLYVFIPPLYHKVRKPRIGNAKTKMSRLFSWLMQLIFFWIYLLIVQQILSIWGVLKTGIMSLFSAVIFFPPVSVMLEVSQPLSPDSDPSLPHGFKIWLKGATAEVKGFHRLKGIGRGITPAAQPLASCTAWIQT